MHSSATRTNRRSGYFHVVATTLARALAVGAATLLAVPAFANTAGLTTGGIVGMIIMAISPFIGAWVGVANAERMGMGDVLGLVLGVVVGFVAGIALGVFVSKLF